MRAHKMIPHQQLAVGNINNFSVGSIIMLEKENGELESIKKFQRTDYIFSIGRTAEVNEMDALSPSYLGINKFFLSMGGQWPHQELVPKIFFTFLMIFFTGTQSLFQIGGAVVARTNIDLLLETIPNILVDFSVGAKIINFFFNSHRMKKLMLLLEEDWQLFNSKPEIEIFNKYGAYARKFTITYLAVMYGTMTPFMVIPVVPIVFNIFAPANASLPKQLLFVQYEYLFNIEKYYYPVILHSYLGTCAFINVVVALDTMCMVYVQHACAMFSIVGYDLEQIQINAGLDIDVDPTRWDDKAYKDMAQCIKKHNRVLEYSKLIEDAHYISYFFQLGVNMICISFTGFVIVMKLDSEPDVSVRFAAFTSTQLAILFLQSFPGQQLFDHSSQIYQDVFRAGWYKTSLRTRRLFVLMSMRSCIPCQLTAGKFYVLGLANFGLVLKTSMSYVMVLLSMK